jgi:hypothetical protein
MGRLQSCCLYSMVVRRGDAGLLARVREDVAKLCVGALETDVTRNSRWLGEVCRCRSPRKV